MDIIEFFQHSAGKWFSQRTCQDLPGVKSVAGTTDLWLDALSSEDPEAIALCQEYGIDPAEALAGVRIRWENKPIDLEPKQSGSTVLVAISNGSQPTEGRLLRKSTTSDELPIQSRYIIGSDDVVTFIAESEDLYEEERIWYASDNLRLRTHVVKRSDGFSLASFYSEIRMGGTPKPS
ncbi:phycobiliprotein lyase [Oscillatoria acuminata]|uniref:Chromophore lyase CpcS/CpeS n=1 Tax=Oscillatoria acuminata PCC 6304 TaxID=56110 RepID=K9TS73_9CYAN|nr:phycobiliprotein lyase [Oscillatoria acuminata]AFY85026.1 phycobilin lyase, CpcU subunit [Oscillatoria acuminata PCC 6304]